MTLDEIERLFMFDMAYDPDIKGATTMLYHALTSDVKPQSMTLNYCSDSCAGPEFSIAKSEGRGSDAG